jgi:hypothetical protein
MMLIDHYLNAVRMYLAPGQPHDDIVNELRENLLSQIEEKEAGLGRPLSEPEQETLLTGHGNPMIVAGRYGATTRNVAFGWQLIGPELTDSARPSPPRAGGARAQRAHPVGSGRRIRHLLPDQRRHLWLAVRAALPVCGQTPARSVAK